MVGWTVAALVLGGSCGRPLQPPIRYPSGIIPGDVQLNVSFDYQTFTMTNGLTVVIAPDDESNLVTVDMRYSVGAADELPGKTGLAHLAEHLTFEVAPDGGDILADRLGEAALSYNAFTNFDSTHYTAVALAPALEQLIEIEALRMTSACEKLSPQLFERERKIVLQELALRAESQAVLMALNRLVWGAEHPFSHGVGGVDLATLSREDYCGFLARHYKPGNATLVIGGRLASIAAAKAYVAKHFGKLQNQFVEAQAKLPELPLGGDVRTAELAVDHPVTLVAYPLAPEGTERRTLEEMAIKVISRELISKANETDAILGAELFRLGSARRGAIGFALTSKTISHDKLVTEILKAVDRAAELQSELYVMQLKGRATSALAERHDDMLGRGYLIADHSQFAENVEYGQAIEHAAGLDPEQLSKAVRASFSRDDARYVYIDKRVGAGATYDLANVGDDSRYELPTKALATTASVPLHQLQPAYKPVEFSLKNGLRVILVPRRDEAFLEARFVLPNGDADDPPGKRGVAELTAELLQGPSSQLRRGDVVALMMAAMSGSTMTGFTTAHQTVFTVSGVPSEASLHLWRLHSMLESGDFPLDGLDQLRKQRAWRAKAEREQAEDPATVAAARITRLQRAVLERMFGAGHASLGSGEKALDEITLADLHAFRERHYRAKGALLVVVGGFNPIRTERDIVELWGTWAPLAPPPPAAAPPVHPQLGQAYLALDRPDSQISLLLSFVARSQPGADSGVRRVATELLGERLEQIRLRLAATYSLSLSYLDLEGASFIQIHGRVAPDRAAEVLAELRALGHLEGDAGALALEVARARRRALQTALAQSSSSATLADTIAEQASGGGALDQQQRQVAAIAAVTTDQLRALVKGDFDAERLVVAASGPGASAVLRAAGAAKVELVE